MPTYDPATDVAVAHRPAAASPLHIQLPFGGAETAAATPRIIWGTGSPESAVTADIGALFLRTDGGASTVLYVKESGTGNTGWIAK